MDDQVYNSTEFWQLLGGVNDFSVWFMPLFLFVASIAWVWRERTIISYIGLFGGLLVGIARITHWLIPSVNSIALGYPEPTIEQNVLVWFFYIQALNIGNFIFVVCISYRFLFWHTHNK